MRGRSLYLTVCGAVAALAFLLSGETNAVDTADAAFSGWPTVFEGRPLQEGPLLPHERAFAARFPGRVGRFACGGRTVIIRWVTRPSHRVHGAADCLRSAGWRITPLPLASDPVGAWGVFRAEQAGVTLRVRERCADAGGYTWSDVSSWFWAALLGRTSGPWQVVSVAERE